MAGMMGGRRGGAAGGGGTGMMAGNGAWNAMRGILGRLPPAVGEPPLKRVDDTMGIIERNRAKPMTMMGELFRSARGRRQ